MNNYFWHIAVGIVLLTSVAAVSAMMMATTEQPADLTPDNEDSQIIITPTEDEHLLEELPPHLTEPTPPPTERPPVTTPTPTSPTECFVGGCSSQVCTSNPDIISTCEWRAEYACYRTATCEVQPSGQCGWTPTNELNSCLANPPAEM